MEHRQFSPAFIDSFRTAFPDRAALAERMVKEGFSRNLVLENLMHVFAYVRGETIEPSRILALIDAGEVDTTLRQEAEAMAARKAVVVAWDARTIFAADQVA